MEIFYSDNIQGSTLSLPAEEAAHCVRVLRHRPGDRIDVIDGRGTLYHCTILDSTVLARIDSSEPGWHAHPYRLTLAVCPTKNPDRYEWMAEKATEVGLDTLVPVIGDRSERKVLGKAERLKKILLSAAKQSLKGAVPELASPLSVRDFVASFAQASMPGPDPLMPDPDPLMPGPDPLMPGPDPLMPDPDPLMPDPDPLMPDPDPLMPDPDPLMPGSDPASPSLRLIAYCSDEVQPRASIMGLLCDFWLSAPSSPEIVVLIGPEGDFSPEEVRAAMAAGFVPVSLGASRLRTETAAVTAAEAVYLSLL